MREVWEEEGGQGKVDVRRLRNHLREAADVLAELGIITNTPYAKFQWIEKGDTSDGIRAALRKLRAA